MFSFVSNVVLGCALLLILLSWIAGSKAARLLYGGSAERLNRKARKQMVWAAYVTLPAAALIVATFIIVQSMGPVFWEDRVLLHLPLIVIPLLSIWVLAVPRQWKLWRATHKTSGPLSAEIRLQAAHPLIIVPFQMSALGGVTLFYFLLVTPVTLHLSSAIVPILIWIAATAAVWYVHDRRWQKVSRPDSFIVYQPWRRRLRALGIFCIAAGIAGVAMFIESQNSKLPAVMSMSEGAMDFGGGTELKHDAKSAVSVAMFTGPREGTPDRKFTLTAEQQTVTLSSGKKVDAWTYNGQIPGPELRMKQGELVEVTLINRDIEDGATIHWHGLDVPNAEDGVAGVTQDAVMPGEKHVYRFIAEQTGTFWYHSHQESQEAVSKGLFGPLIVEPALPAESGPVEDLTVMTHVWDGVGFAIGSYDTLQRKQVTPGTPVRLRLINTQDWVRQKYVLTGTSFRVAALDGTELHEPEDLRDSHVVVSTGGRADLTFIMPDHPVFLSIGGNKKLGILLSRDGTGEIPDIPKTELFDALNYCRDVYASDV
ncbi:multicopper oxidase family protein [Cohnella sp.]|uniref:multicopper oxidase family protein n=1 Tax=Cohnella sp. TaxID=1883426 RepID=UPI003567EE21